MDYTASTANSEAIEAIKALVVGALISVKSGIEAANQAYPGEFSLAIDRGIEIQLTDPDINVRFYVEPSRDADAGRDAHRAALGKN